MKKILTFGLALMLILSLAGCGRKQTTFDIKIVVPAGSTDAFVYSESEVSPLKITITAWAGDGLGDTEVVLKKANESGQTTPAYLTQGMPVKLSAAKGEWYQIGVAVQNPTEEDITVYVTVNDVDIRIKD